MLFKLTIKKSDSSPVKATSFTWRIKDNDGKSQKGSGTADTDDKGLLTFTFVNCIGGDKVVLENDNLTATFQIIVVKPELNKTVTVEEVKIEPVKVEDTLYGEISDSKYDISENNRVDYDWIIWETEGNADPKYQRGGKTRKLGLYKLNYDKLRKAGGDDWKLRFKEASLKGGGWIKIAVLESEDYSNHKELINMFLPCFEIKDGKIEEPAEHQIFTVTAPVSRSPINSITPNTVNVKPPMIILPFNYDDNGEGSRAVGKNLTEAVFGKVDAARLKNELTRWATASRSTITAFPKAEFPNQLFPKGIGTWKSKDLSSDEITPENKWDLRPSGKEAWTTQITGPLDGVSLRTFQKDTANAEVKYYSVKTGVQYVSTQNQISTSKDLLEENSIHAMNRSNLIKATMKRLAGKFEAAYQVEILSILLLKDPDAMKSVAEEPQQLENKALKDDLYQYREKLSDSLRESLEKLREDFSDKNKTELKEKIEKVLASKVLTNFVTDKEFFDTAAELKIIDEATGDFEVKVKDLISRIKLVNEEKAKILSDRFHVFDGKYADNKPVVREKISEVLNSKIFDIINSATEIKIIEQAKTADDYEEKVENLIQKIGTPNLIQFRSFEEPIKHIRAKLGFDGIQVREISDAGINDIWFPALAIPCHGKAFAKNWGKTDDWRTFWKDNFAVPLGRAKAEMLVYFGMQHMTSNSQNFITSFDRKTEGGKLKKLILRDIGDTLYNNHFFEVLKDLHTLYKKEWEHESKDTDFGVTLSSALGSYTMPRMTRIGATIVFFFGPFIQGDIAESKDCYKILVDWCVAHNRAFFDYMKEKIGYSEDWGGGGKDDVSPTFLNALSKRCNLNKANDLMYQKFVVPDVLELSSKARLKLIKEFETKMQNIPEVDDKNKKTTETLGIELVNAHEVLICAEIQRYIQSEKGKTALKNLHKQTPTETGHICFNCKTAQKTDSKNWHRCTKCDLKYCAVCAEKMPLPTGISERLRKATEERKCLDCNNITELIK